MYMVAAICSRKTIFSALCRKEFGIMKKQLIKGILAATLAFVTVLGAPVGVAQSVKSDNTIIAYAACNHNYRHYGEWGDWYFTGQYKPISGHNYKTYKKHYYSTCVNCGTHHFILETRTKYVY